MSGLNIEKLHIIIFHLTNPPTVHLTHCYEYRSRLHFHKSNLFRTQKFPVDLTFVKFLKNNYYQNYKILQ